MNIEQRAAVHAALGDPLRLSVADALLVGDRTPASLGTQLGIPSNLLAHHTKVLLEAGVVTRVPSEADRRRVYLHLTDTGAAALGRTPVHAQKILFVCTHNSARSQFAEALWREHSGIPVDSAGTHPAERVHPMAVSTARRKGLDLDEAAPTPLTGGAMTDALVVTVCDSADEELQPLGMPHLHWSVPDPVTAGRAGAFDDAFDTIAERVDRLAHAITPEEHR
jgi:protein-tyrosine-phosphatase/DNA-binding HxlR family transcriptional regulator